MKKLMFSIAAALGLLVSAAHAQQMVMVDGEQYRLSDLMANCQAIVDDPAAQVACFAAISRLMEEQSQSAPEVTVSVTEPLNAFRAVAEYNDAETGLLISGDSCQIRVVYFANYFHISRRNISSIDLFSAEFDLSNIQLDSTTEVPNAQAPLLKVTMAPGATGSMRGGVGLESAQHNFEAKSPRVTLDEYAASVADQLPATEGRTFDFVLFHPNKAQNRTEIWTAFEALADACRQSRPAWSTGN